MSTTVTYHVGDALTVLREMPSSSVDLVLSSPPFLALRSYLPADHPDKAHEMGSEPTPGAYIDGLLDIVEECRRVLAPHGSLCFELGDTYAGSGGAGGDYAAGGMRDGQIRFDGSASKAFGTGAAPRPARDRWRSPTTTIGRGRDRTEVPRNLSGGDGWPLDKSLCLIPESLRWAMTYGHNPFTGRETPRWRTRNVVRWCRPNPPVGALADKVRPATSDMLIACMNRKRYFDLDAVRGPGSANTHARTARGVESLERNGKSSDRGGNWSSLPELHETNGAPPLDHWWHDEDTFDQDAWLISTEPVKLKHYATWPTDLLVTPIEAMCPRKVCLECGKPSERIVDVSYVDSNGKPAPPVPWSSGMAEGKGAHSLKVACRTTTTTTGWTDCGHNAYRPGIVLDPFAGTGTTGLVAHGHGRSAVLIDLDERNLELARQRIGFWLAEAPRA